MENTDPQEMVPLTLEEKELENENEEESPNQSSSPSSPKQKSGETSFETVALHDTLTTVHSSDSGDVISPEQVSTEPSTSNLKTQSPVELAVERYKDAVKNWAACESQEALLEYHKNCFNQATEGHLNAKEKAEAKMKLDNYFMYILELYEEQRNVPVQNSLLCIEYTNEMVSMGFYIRAGNGQDFSSAVSARRSHSYPPNIVTSRDEIMGYILKAAKQLDAPIPKNTAKEQQKVVEILEWTKKYNENDNISFDQAIIIVPAWFKAEHGIMLRQLAHKAGFKKCYLVSDATLAAYTALGKVSREMPTVVVVSVGILGVDVGMYTMVNRVMKMVALEKYEWELNEGDSEMRGCTLACIRIGRGNKIRRAMEAQEDRLKILKTTATRAADQLDEDIQQKRKETYLVSESKTWVPEYQTFVEQFPGASNGATLPEHWEISAAMTLSNSAGKIRQAIIDHVLPVDPTIDIAVEISTDDTSEN